MNHRKPNQFYCLLGFITVLSGLPRMPALGQERDMFGGKWPAYLSTKSDIKSAKANVTSIDIRKLPITEYPLLRKFTRVREIGLCSQDSTSATDDKFRALAALDLTNVISIVANNGRLISDDGIRALSRIPSLRSVGLEGAVISDAACEVMATQMRLTGVNIANCDGVTLKGLKTLAPSETLEEFSFSANALTQADVVALVASFKTITWCGIVDPKQKLDATALNAIGKKRNIRMVISATGALQDTWAKGKGVKP